jgi:putative transposase
VCPTMPRQTRLDAPDTLRHVMDRWLERQCIFPDDPGRADFVARIAEQGVDSICAWAILPTHAHLLVRTGPRLLRRGMVAPNSAARYMGI